jgi:hypothetical protein
MIDVIYAWRHCMHACMIDGVQAGWTPLHEAVLQQWMPLAELLIKNGADVNAKINVSSP